VNDDPPVAGVAADGRKESRESLIKTGRLIPATVALAMPDRLVGTAETSAEVLDDLRDERWADPSQEPSFGS
jgi:hypothetical protein